MLDDAVALAAIRHVSGHGAQETGIANLHYRATRTANHDAVELVLARRYRGDAGMYAEKSQQRLQLRRKLSALHADVRIAPAIDRAVGVDQSGQKGQEMTFRLRRNPLRHAQRGRLRADLAVDELDRAARAEAGDREIPYGRAALCRGRAGHGACRRERGEEFGIALDHFALGCANLEHQPLAEFARAARPFRARWLIGEFLRVRRSVAEVRACEPRIPPTCYVRGPGKAMMNERVGELHFVGAHVTEGPVPMHQHRMLDRRSQGRAVRCDADVLRLRHVGGHVLRDRAHLEAMLLAVIAQDFAVLLGNGTIGRHETALRAHEGSRRNAPGLQRKPRLMDLFQYVVHRIADGAGHSAVDGRRGGLVLERARVGCHASGRNRSVTQRPEERLIPLLPHFGRFHIGERTRDTLVRVVHRAIDRRAVLCNQAIFLIPDVIGRFLIRNAANVFWLDLDHRIHGYPNRSLIVMARSSNTSSAGPSSRRCRAVISKHGDSRGLSDHYILWLVRRLRPERNDRQGFCAANSCQKTTSISIDYKILSRHSLSAPRMIFLACRIAQPQHLVVHILCTICSTACPLTFPNIARRDREKCRRPLHCALK